MDSELVQRTRYLLRSRFRRPQTCPDALFSQTCHQLVTWLTNHPITAGHLHALHRVECDAVQRIRQTAADLEGQVRSYNPGFYSAQSADEHAAVCLEIVEKVASFRVVDLQHATFLVVCFGEYLTGNPQLKPEEALRTVRDVAVDGLFEYIDEQLDARNVLLALLRKYKQRCEWFHRSRLVKAGAEGLEGRSGERALVLDLHEYLVDQGVEFFVEPSSSSGEADLVLRDANGRYIVVDAKHLKPEDSVAEVRRKLAFGFHQVVRYCEDYNESAGYLVGFDESPRRIHLELDESDGWNYLNLGGKAVYYLGVSIAALPSASRAGRAEEISVTAEDLRARPSNSIP